MRKNKVIIVFLIFIIVLNCNALLVQSVLIPNYELEETFEFILPEHYNETVILSDFIDITLFETSDNSLEFIYYTEDLAESFYLNNVELIWIYQEIQFLDDSTLKSFVRLKFANGFGIQGSINFEIENLPTITTKRLYNPNNYEISIFIDVAIIHDYYEYPKLFLFMLLSFVSIGFIITITVSLWKKR